MFTIKHVDSDGMESTLEVLSVKYFKNSNRVIAPAPDGVTKYVYATGKVFVMNDLGKTVSIYDFSSSNAQQKEQQHG